MKTLIYYLRKHNLPVEEKVKVYSQFYERLMMTEPLQEDSVIRHYLVKADALKRTDRYLKIYGDKLTWE